MNAARTLQTSADLETALCSDVAQLNALAARNLETDEAEAVSIARELTVILTTTIETFSELEQLNTPAEADHDLFAAVQPDTRVSLRALKVSPVRLEDVCFAGALELNRALRDLREARDLETLRAASERARRKLGRSVHAVLKLSATDAAISVNACEQLQAQLQRELSSALAVRKLYAEFRHALRRPENESSDAVLTALRYAAGAVAILTGSPHFAEMRVADRALLRRQRDRLLEWSRSGKAPGAGVQLLEDIFTCADLLRDINRRQELHAHDRQQIRDLLQDSAQTPAPWLQSLECLSGLDDTLDSVIAQARSHGQSRGLELVMDAVVRLSFLL